MIELLTSIVIDISDQRLYAYAGNNSLVYSTLVSTGKAHSPTPLGEFSIVSKYTRTDLVGKDYRVNLPYVMCLDNENVPAEMYCIHPTPYPEIPLGQKASRGCIRTSLEAARWLFNRTSIQTPVTIQP
jgi:lipoprotein-anchoring transpeptidase ErfK/SrfK